MIVDTPWVKAQDIHRNVEGRQVWQYNEKDDTMIITTVPRGFSRTALHCEGIWWMEIIRPPIPAAVM